MPDAAAYPSIIQTGARVRAAYAEGAGIYRIVPRGVAVPSSLADLRDLVRWANASGQGLIARGAGSGIPGGAVGPGIIVDLRERMPRRLELDPQRAIAVTSASITQAELNRTALPHGLRLPPDPSSSGWATLGGMVATNAAGARTVRYGPVRRWVEALEVVTADGEVEWLSRGSPQSSTSADVPPSRLGGHSSLAALQRFQRDVAPGILAARDSVLTRFPRTRKNTAGYALDQWLASGDDLDLLIGAEGTLALVTAIRWRLDPIPRARSGLRIALRSLTDLEEAVQSLVALDPSAVELLDRTFLELVARQGGAGQAAPERGIPAAAEAVLLVEFERDEPAAARGVAGDAVRAVSGIALDVETALTPEEERRLWALRHAASPILASLPPERRSMQVIEDGCVPLARLGEYVAAVRAAARDRGLTVVIFGHAGDGNVHVNVLPELARADWRESVVGLFEDVSAATLRLGGTVSGEHGDGRLRVPLLERQYGTEVMGLFRRVKTAFDPHGIFNPGVKLGGMESSIQQLKLGPTAAAIPEDIAGALRDIERTGGYARSRLEIARSEGEVTGGG
jgi:FAD/FMN-containing dehydrogenase